eukprot:CAMPEP_0118942060 /NCGR_PEP_ID=MMETSP1169-20130426/35266_1 /TAXON_ID=36882 /ORGANISM="Pyramimonas obovata, Strain CCMP722" /LENGTH=316 /DNA_ID=CAMNT_0006886979 /DNA_START=75 /DNA_END=1022 /DNA_ORIENTATION=+
MESEAPAKRARIDEGQAKAASASSGEDQITSSIEKIASHIGNLKKFTKAASLARQLLRSGQFERKYGKAFMKVLEAAMQDPSRVHDPLLRNDYRALFLAVEAEAESFSKPDRDQINVWSLRAVLTNELHTDDTYGFNKVLAKIKEQVEKLPVWVEFVPEVIPPPPPGPPPEPEEEEEEEDIFGLDSLLPSKRKQEEEARKMAAMAARAEARAAAKAAALLDQRRDALIRAVEEAFGFYNVTTKNWTRVPVDMLVAKVHEVRAKFAPGQRDRLQKVYNRVKEQQTRRRQVAQQEAARDRSAFETAQSKYAGMDISIR